MTWIIKEKGSTVILICRYWLVNYYLAKGFVIIQHNSKHLCSIPNEKKQIIRVIPIQKHILLWIFTQ